MPVFRFRAVQASGLVHKGQRVAVNENDLMRMLRDSGLELIEAKEHKPVAAPSLALKARKQNHSVLVVMACRQLTGLLRAGLPFPEALHSIAQTMPPGMLRNKLDAIGHSLHQGSTIADAFGQHPDLFNPVFLAMLRTGETGGHLLSTFEQLTHYVERQARFQQQLRRALRYPIFLLCLALGATAFMLTMVVPKVLAFLTSLSVQLPWPTRVLVRLSGFVVGNWWVLLLGVFAVAAGAALGRRFSGAFALRLDRWFLALPGIGPTLHKLALARFAHSFSLLLTNGADLPGALALSKDVLGNRALVEAAKASEKDVQSGKPLSAAMAVLFPPFVTQMLAVGEKSGNLPGTLRDAAHVHDEEAQAAVDQFIGSLEPALTLFVGLLLAWVVLAVLGPVYGSLGQLSAGGAM